MPLNSQPVPRPIITIAKAIDHYFELSLYLLVLTGFGTLASTGGLDLPTVLAVGAALAVRGYLLAKRRRIIISERWTTPLTITYFLFFAVDYLLISRSFLGATVHLALFAVLVRMFSLRRERDHITLAILAFLMVLAAAVLTVDSVFLIFFAAFMLMAVATFILMEMRRSGRAADIQARHSNDPHEHRRLAFSLVRTTPVLMLLILAGAAAVFFLLPRMSAGYLGAYSFGTDLSTGFSDRVQLGQIGRIQQSNALVMHIQIDGDTNGKYDLHWRGIALSKFDGHTWSNPHTEFLLQPNGKSFAIPSMVPRTPDPVDSSLSAPHFAKRPDPKLIHYRVLMEPIGTNVFFLAPWARSVTGDYRRLGMDASSGVFDLDGEHPVGRYEADSDISTPSPPQLRAAGQNYSPAIAEGYLRLPVALDRRIPQLAGQITGPASNDYDKAVAIENYLRTHYGYTLQLPSATLDDPLANFLFDRRQGHCEYFASSMAVMLRTLGIPSRLVNGFRSDEFNDLTGNYVVRAKNAHTWIEAYFPGYGWQTFDPTPSATGGAPRGWDRAMLYLDAAASFWREWIISYDSSHQLELGHAALAGTASAWERSRTWARQHYDAMLKWAQHKQERVEQAPRRWAAIGFVIGLLVLLLGNVARILRWFQQVSLQAHPENSPQQAASMWYERMATALARRGIRRMPAQTPKEFLTKIGDQTLRAKVDKFTEAYEGARFGRSPEDAQRLPELYGEVELMTKR
jgi:transglutaminase-like putative cysteine protease